MIERVVLLGFMAAGKSTVARLLAERLQWTFVDLDDEIVLRTGHSVEDLFRRGEHAFRAEEAAATEALAPRGKMVLAPGGGWITNEELPRVMGSGTAYVWLRIDAASAVLRARRETTVRPLLATNDPEEAARRLLAVRTPLYEAWADLAVEAAGRTPESITDDIERWLKQQRTDGDEQE